MAFTFKKELETYRGEVQKLQASLDSSASDFEQQSVMLSPTQRQAKRKELEGQQDKLQQRTQELQERASARERELLEPMQQRLKAVIDGIRAEGNYAAVIDLGNPNIASFIVSYDKSLDITIQVARRLQGS